MVRRLILVVSLFILFALSSILVSAHAERSDAAPQPEVVAKNVATPLPHAPDHLLVKFRAGTDSVSLVDGAWQTGRASLDRSLAVNEVQSARRLFTGPALKAARDAAGLDRIYLLHIAPGRSIQNAVQILALDPSVEWAEPDYLAYPVDTTPNDPLFEEQWGLNKIQAPAAWDVATGASTVAIAIVDSGIDMAHPDLAGKVWVNPGEVANGLDDDNNGYTDDVNGWDFVSGDKTPSDDYGHGTQVAGVAAAATNNARGVAGVCWGCKIMPVKVMQASGVANYSDIAAGVLYAAQKGARVINLSLGGYSDSYALRTAVETATAMYGATIVAGAGNDNLATPFYPAAYDSVLAVAGTCQTDAKAALSNFGVWVDVAAPATTIETTFMGGDYGSADGTSYAASFVSGIAGLLHSQNPSWSGCMVHAQVIQTADNIDSLNLGFEGLLGRGRANANAAMTTTPEPLLLYLRHVVDGVASGRPDPGTTVDLNVTLYNDWAGASSVQATLTSADPYVTIVHGSASFGDIPTYAAITNATAFRFTVSASAPYAHDILLTLHVTSGGGYSVNIPLTVQTASSIYYPPATLTTQTWTNDRIYIINKETGIPAGETLIIEPGTEIRFDGLYSLNVGGTLIANGTEAQPILFTSHAANPMPGDWAEIRFLNSSVGATFDTEGNYLAGSILQHTIIEYGQGVRLDYASPLIAHSQFNFDSGVTGSGAVIGGFGRFEATLVVANNTVTAIDPSCFAIALSAEELRVVENVVTGGWGGLSVGGLGTVARNSVSVPGLGIDVQGLLTVTANRVINSYEGISVQGGIINGNLVANNRSHGIHISNGSPTVISNTIVFNGETGIYIEATVPSIRYNNLIASTHGFALHNATATAIAATNNWWGTTDAGTIQDIIYDGADHYGLGVVDNSGYLEGPEQSAPAYIISVNIFPDTTLGIQTATFEAEFSGPMDQEILPKLSFRSVKDGTWTVYDPTNSKLTGAEVNVVTTDTDGSHWVGTWDAAMHFDGTSWTRYDTLDSGIPFGVMDIIQDPDGSHWFGTWNAGALHFDGIHWKIYNMENSGLLSTDVFCVALDPDGSHWFSMSEAGVTHFDGTNWTVYDTTNSGLPSDKITAIATDTDGTHWFGTYDRGVAHFDGTSWTVYDTTNSGLPVNSSNVIVTHTDGTHWFGTWGAGAARFDGQNWKVYNTTNSGLPHDCISSIISDSDGSLWFATWGGVARFDGTSWTVYNTANSELPSDSVTAVATGLDQSHWFGAAGSVAVLWSYPSYIIENDLQWLDDRTYRATYDITSLIPRSDYVVSVEGAMGTDGIEIAPVVGYTFTVDYAGAIGDNTPPPVPAVEACASTDVGTVSVSWSAYDPDSAITLYHYAIGTTPGGTEVINWTNTSVPSFERTGLGLIFGQIYYVAVQARNEGGLWSEASIPGVVAGSGICTTNKRSVYLPLIMLNN